jgi:DNA-binding MarR family transcriptional regulator
MPAPAAATLERRGDIEAVAGSLPLHASRFIRLLRRYTKGDVTPSMGAVLSAVADGSRRITELAELEGLAQPSITLIVAKLEERGWVKRRQDAGDRRIVQVTITAAGRAALESRREAVRTLLAARLKTMSDQQIAALAAASEALVALNDALQQGETGEGMAQ